MDLKRKVFLLIRLREDGEARRMDLFSAVLYALHAIIVKQMAMTCSWIAQAASLCPALCWCKMNTEQRTKEPRLGLSHCGIT